MEWVAVVQQLNRDLLAIEMARSGLLLQQQAIRSVALLDPAPQSPVSKAEFKELGSAGMIIEQVAVEAVIRHYQALECRISPDEKSSIGGAYAKLRGCHHPCRKFTGDDWLNQTRIRGAAAAFRARVGGLFAGPHH
jgi:hypothetical protein